MKTVLSQADFFRQLMGWQREFDALPQWAKDALPPLVLVPFHLAAEAV
ncbi:hypothetical protein LGM89_00820 [Burkholderia sp. AU31624]|nr:hypothetical protein [Burkholderia sp. AU31624]MCA8251793.1 hypothetical protein [Burkholderia sp. AU31624]